MTIDIRSMGYARVASTNIEQWKRFAGKVLGLGGGARARIPRNLYYRMDEVLRPADRLPRQRSTRSPSSAGSSRTTPH